MKKVTSAQSHNPRKLCSLKKISFVDEEKKNEEKDESKKRQKFWRGDKRDKFVCFVLSFCIEKNFFFQMQSNIPIY